MPIPQCFMSCDVNFLIVLYSIKSNADFIKYIALSMTFHVVVLYLIIIQFWFHDIHCIVHDVLFHHALFSSDVNFMPYIIHDVSCHRASIDYDSLSSYIAFSTRFHFVMLHLIIIQCRLHIIYCIIHDILFCYASFIYHQILTPRRIFQYPRRFILSIFIWQYTSCPILHYPRCFMLFYFVWLSFNVDYASYITLSMTSCRVMVTFKSCVCIIYDIFVNQCQLYAVHYLVMSLCVASFSFAFLFFSLICKLCHPISKTCESVRFESMLHNIVSNGVIMLA